ncbi:MAG: hypothetical protein HQK89_17045 [Nitrospirae bacterium]|nr:hypothetical protein [Nitrospirota bacterium]
MGSIPMLDPQLLSGMKEKVSGVSQLLGLANEGKKAALEDVRKSSYDIKRLGRNISNHPGYSKEDDKFRQARFRLAELLKEIAPTEYRTRQWGDKDADDRLERLRMKDNTYRWLCKKHADEYRKMF